MQKVDTAELRRLHAKAEAVGGSRRDLAIAMNTAYLTLPALLDELESLREEVRRLKQHIDGFKPVGGDYTKAAKAIGAAEEFERSAKTLREDLADMNPPEFASRGKVAPGYCECLQDVADGMEERAAKLRREADSEK